MKINSKISNVVWNIETRELNKHDILFIENFNPPIYHNDIDCYLWSFDEKLPSGAWLENIRFNNEITEAKALVL
ncbi:TPA: hypothetical protein ACVT6Z_001439 [Clostridioides difficile]|uniref:hypothetical protein n=1 Tax=Clostridioides difficile TaxID=1496 RepID=UPI0020C57DB8|nr:hypothetical protein [Clostridioides difficile]MCP8368519.1 hypothetical protein [Clostridioides difficile]MCP8386727.1 hypothetical protein [Clostridioides difficile]HCQ5967490.1 hypothetical protein [Clostridioides difficile]